MDSTVLLHAIARCRETLSAPVVAWHIDHRLQAASRSWSDHCREACERLAVPFESIEVDAAPLHGESPEAAARRARYAALDLLLQSGDLLLTAHHRDDQAETLLLQLLRGAGVDGLASMPLLGRRGAAWHGRPLLGWSRTAIHDWARQQALRWIEDPSNADLQADRNFLRQQVMPLLAQRWPAVSQAIARSAVHCAEAAETLSQLAERDLGELLEDGDSRLRLERLAVLDPIRQRRVLRHWIRRKGWPVPPRRRLIEGLQQFHTARVDRLPLLQGEGWSMRRYRHALWLVPDAQVPAGGTRISWDGAPLHLGTGLGRVSRRMEVGGIDPAHWIATRVELAFNERPSGCRPVGQARTRTFKNLLQEAGVPPWQRPLLPLLFLDGRLAAIAGVCVAAEFAAPAGEQGWVVDWQPD